MKQLQSFWPVRYGLAVLVVALAVLLALALGPDLSQSRLVIFCAAVALAAWFGGLGPGLLASLLSMAAVDYFFIAPLSSLTFGLTATDVPGFLIFSVTVMLISFLS